MEPAEFTKRGQHVDAVEHDEPRGPSATVTEGSRSGAEPADEEDGLGAPVGSIVSRPALVVSPDSTVGEAARAMREAGTGSVLVEAPSPGIVTDRDLRNRVLADERTAETPVRAIMSRPLKTLPADTPLHEVLLLMLDEDVHHVPVTRDGRIVGVVTDKDCCGARRGDRSRFWSGSSACGGRRRSTGTRSRWPRLRGRSLPTMSNPSGSPG